MIRFSRGRSGGPSARPPTSPSSPSPGPLSSPVSGSRFSCLVDDEDSDDDRVRALAEEVAWGGFQDEPLGPPVICQPEIPLEEVAKDFWCIIGFPMPESCSWQRSAASTGKTEVSSNVLSELCRARSLSPVKTGRRSDDRRASSSSPVGLHLAKPPHMGAWRGPLPRRRVTPTPVLRDFIACAKTSTSGASVVPRLWSSDAS
jgi:hypothetical protein